jgi:predicted Zn-dependent protease
MVLKTVEDVAAVLAGVPALRAWSVTETRTRSNQRYTVFARDEALRQVATTRWRVLVHTNNVKADGNASMGESSVTLDPPCDAGVLRAAVEAAVERARLVHNQPYVLPGPAAAVVAARTVDDGVVENAQGVANAVVAEIRGAAVQHPGVDLSSSEVFADHIHQRILNSRGLDITRSETDVLVEYVLLAGGGAEEVEIWQSPRSRLLDTLRVGEHIHRMVRFTKDGLAAQPTPSGTYDVVFGEDALDTLWDCFVAQAGAAARFDGWSKLTVGGPLIKDLQGEALTLWSDPTLPGGRASATFDAEGTPCRKVALVENNVVTALHATARYAQLTGVEATGGMGNVVVAPGKTPYAQLLGGPRPVLELLRFSQLSPNGISGAFSGEIRSGYVHDGGKVTPIKGGSVSGDVWTAFARATFSAETVRREAYEGPRGVKLAGLTTAGG